MLSLFRRNLFFSIPSLSSLSDAEKAQKLSELMDSFSSSFSKDHQQKTRDLKSSFSPDQLEKLDLILDQLLKLNTYETMALRKLVMANNSSEYNWPIFPRPKLSSSTIKPGTELTGLGIISSSVDLIEKIIDVKKKKEEVIAIKEEVKEAVVEKTTFNLVLVGFDPASKVKFIKCVKDALGLGLKESKDKVEEVAKGPVVLFKSVSKESHGKICEQLLAAGGQVEFQ